jgi:amino acid transporter
MLLCLAVLSVLTFLNLRGIREAGKAFMPPTYLFIGFLGIVIFIGIFKALASGGPPEAAIPPPNVPHVGRQINLWLFLKAFAAGCTAMTGVEAVSNGVQAFKEPVVRSARITLTLIVAILILLLLGVAYLVFVYQIVATEPGSSNYQSILSLLTQAVVGRGVFYYITLGSILLVLCLSANTSFADFPRVCRTISLDGYLPASFAVRGRRLVFTEGIFVLTVLSGALLTIFNGVTDRLIPLFAVGAFLAFTLSQCGMVVHWLKSNEASARVNAAINGIGALATGTTFVIVIRNAHRHVQGVIDHERDRSHESGMFTEIFLCNRIRACPIWVSRYRLSITEINYRKNRSDRRGNRKTVSEARDSKGNQYCQCGFRSVGCRTQRVQAENRYAGERPDALRFVF